MTKSQALSTAEALVSEQSQTPSGTLRITALPGYGEKFVLPVLEKLRVKFPQIIFDINFTDQVVDLSGNAIDIAIRTATKLPDHVVARRLVDHYFVLVASPDYLNINGTPKKLDDLKSHPALMYRGPNGVFNWQAKQQGNAWQEVPLSPSYICNNGQSLLDGVLAGQGIAMLPGWGVQMDIAAGRLEAITLEDADLSSNGTNNAAVYLLYHSPKFRLQKVRVVVDCLLKELTG